MMELLCVKQETRLKRFFCDFLQIPTITFFIARPPYTLLRDVGPSSVVRPGCHILKTKQDKHTVTIKHFNTIQKLAPIIYCRIQIHPQTPPLGDILVSNLKKNMFKY